MKIHRFFLKLLITIMAAHASQGLAQGLWPEFSAPMASENKLSFDHVYVTELTQLSEVAKMTDAQKRSFVAVNIEPLMKFLFGPAVLRSVGSPQRGASLTVQWDAATVKSGRVILPFHYSGTWILDREVAKLDHVTLPVPLNYRALFSAGWKKCTDSAPEHATTDFYWYFWDPARPGCDHVKGTQYANVEMQIGEATTNQKLSYPEYDRMFRGQGADRNLAVTVAFGYVEDPIRPQPEMDRDPGAYEYRAFAEALRGSSYRFSETPVLLSEYNGGNSDLVIGHRFTAAVHGVSTTVTVVMAAGVDQMIVFAKSFAHDHDAVFAWMGHSRVGNGFDALQFQALVRGNPEYYSVSEDYQVIYWGGCNSYSYYTLPFFDFKARASKGRDPNGTKNLDIIAHGLPSLFAFGTSNAGVLVSAVLNWPKRTSYQTILGEIEKNSRQSGVTLLAAVLGDEDNP